MLTDKEKIAYKHNIQSNQHEIFVVSFEEMDAIIKSTQVSAKPELMGAWESMRGKAEFGASYYATADDLVTLSKLVGDLGSVGAKAYVKNYGGKPHIILKGYPGLRKVLTGTKYGVKNPKVISMGLGKAGAVDAAKSGALISIVLLSTYRVVDYFFRDQATLSELLGALATDVVKVGIAVGASIAAAAGAAAVFSIAIGPLVAAIFVGVGVSYLLSRIDEEYGITDRVIVGIDELGNDVGAYIENRKRELEQAGERAVESVIDYAVDSAKSILVNTAKGYIRKLTVPYMR